MTNKDIQQLIDKYLAGETSPTEERQLALELHQRQDVTEEWQTICLMLGELTQGEAEYDAIIKQRANKPSAIIIVLRTITSIAAVLLVGLFLYQHLPTEKVNEEPHYYTSTPSAGSTLKNVYQPRQHQEKMLSYTQFKTMLYENK